MQDCLIVLSTSGNSDNIIKAVETARKHNCTTIALLGKGGGKLKNICDIELIVPSSSTQRIQEVHLIIGHTLCEHIEENFLK